MGMSNTKKVGVAALALLGTTAIVGAGTGAAYTENHYANYSVQAGTLQTDVTDAQGNPVGGKITAPVDASNISDTWEHSTKLTITNNGTLPAQVRPASISAAPHYLKGDNDVALASQLDVQLQDAAGAKVTSFTLAPGESRDVYLVAKTQAGGLTNAAEGGRAHIQFQYTTVVAN